MSTQKQLDANRRNARRSNGPKTPEGKAKSSQNAIVHGLLARDPVGSGEYYEDHAELFSSLQEDLQPVGPNEEFLVRQIVEAQSPTPIGFVSHFLAPTPAPAPRATDHGPRAPDHGRPTFVTDLPQLWEALWVYQEVKLLI